MNELLQLVHQLESLAKPEMEMDLETFANWQESARMFAEELEDEE